MLEQKGRGFLLSAWADDFGRWHCRADFPFPGVGNSPEAEALKFRALASAKRRIRSELKARQAQPLRRLSYEVTDNKLDSMNRLHSLTISERWDGEN